MSTCYQIMKSSTSLPEIKNKIKKNKYMSKSYRHLFIIIQLTALRYTRAAQLTIKHIHIKQNLQFNFELTLKDKQNK